MHSPIIQIAIAISTVLSIYLTQQARPHWQKYACLIGMAGQPIWLLETYNTQQWGMLFSSCCITAVWGIGIKNHWLKK